MKMLQKVLMCTMAFILAVGAAQLCSMEVRGAPVPIASGKKMEIFPEDKESDTTSLEENTPSSQPEHSASTEGSEYRPQGGNHPDASKYELSGPPERQENSGDIVSEAEDSITAEPAQKPQNKKVALLTSLAVVLASAAILMFVFRNRK